MVYKKWILAYRDWGRLLIQCFIVVGFMSSALSTMGGSTNLTTSTATYDSLVLKIDTYPNPKTIINHPGTDAEAISLTEAFRNTLAEYKTEPIEIGDTDFTAYVLQEVHKSLIKPGAQLLIFLLF